jgi:hypothetical protein
MALSFQGKVNDGNSLSVIVEGDGSSTTLAVALKSACFAPWFTDDNSVLPLQLANAAGTAIFGTSSIAYTLAIGSSTVTFTFATAPPSGVYSNPIAIGLKYP